MATNKNDNTKLVSILSYFLVGIIWYFVDTNVQNKKTKFHVKQALNLTIINIGLSIIISFIFFIPFIYILMMLVKITIFILWILGLINAINQKEEVIPLIGNYADKYLTF